MGFKIALVLSLFLAVSFSMSLTHSEEVFASEEEVFNMGSLHNLTTKNVVLADALDAVELTLGFFDGLNSVIGIQTLDSCLLSNIIVIDEVKAAIEFLKSKMIVKGLTTLGSALEDISQVATNCQVLEEDLKFIESAAEALKNPKSLIANAENILINGARVDQEIHAALEAEKLGEYYNLGEAIGQIVGLASTRNPQSESN